MKEENSAQRVFQHRGIHGGRKEYCKRLLIPDFSDQSDCSASSSRSPLVQKMSKWAIRHPLVPKGYGQSDVITPNEIATWFCWILLASAMALNPIPKSLQKYPTGLKNRLELYFPFSNPHANHFTVIIQGLNCPEFSTYIGLPTIEGRTRFFATSTSSKIYVATMFALMSGL